MITTHNFSALIQTLNPETLRAIQDGSFFEHDYVLMEAHIFNIGGFATIESVEYSEEIEKDAAHQGDLFCDADSFLQLIEEAQALEL